jgi:hypothetical protein
MSREEDRNEDPCELSELESALSALVPRAERFNRDRLMFLAGQASVEPKTCQPPMEAIANLSGLPHIGDLSHVLEASPPRPRGRWAWPAAFATMTGIAASLLVALAIRPAPQVVERIVRAPAVAQGPAAIVAHGHVATESERPSWVTVVALPDWLAWGLFAQSDAGTKHEPSYAELRNQVLRHGVEPWSLQASESNATGGAQGEPFLDREQFNRWLEQEGLEKPSRRISNPTLRNLLGVKS